MVFEPNHTHTSSSAGRCHLVKMYISVAMFAESKHNQLSMYEWTCFKHHVPHSKFRILVYEALDGVFFCTGQLPNLNKPYFLFSMIVRVSKALPWLHVVCDCFPLGHTKGMTTLISSPIEIKSEPAIVWIREKSGRSCFFEVTPFFIVMLVVIYLFTCMSIKIIWC